MMRTCKLLSLQEVTQAENRSAWEDWVSCHSCAKGLVGPRSDQSSGNDKILRGAILVVLHALVSEIVDILDQTTALNF